MQKSESASGHRLRIGDHQLLLYRSLREPELPRAVLGQHTLSETIIGRFDSNGDLTPIVTVNESQTAMRCIAAIDLPAIPGRRDLFFPGASLHTGELSRITVCFEPNSQRQACEK